MHIALWILQALLAAAFALTGGMKLAMPLDLLLVHGMTFVEHLPAWLVRGIGLAEIAGALGLVLPSALKIRPHLTPLAATLLLVVMILAVGTHLALAEPAKIGAPFLLGGLSALVAWGRFRRAVIEPRGRAPAGAAAESA